MESHVLELAACSEERALRHLVEELFGKIGISLGLLEYLDDFLESDLIAKWALSDFLEEHHSLVVEVDLIKLLLNSESDVEFLSKGSSPRSMELEGCNMMIFACVDSDISVLSDSQWNIEAMSLEWSDLEIDWYDDLFENLSSSSSEYASEDASWLVWLLGLVLEVNSGNESFSWSTGKDTWNRDNLCSSESPTILLRSLGSISSLALASERTSTSHEFPPAASASAATSSASSTSKLLEHVLEELGTLSILSHLSSHSSHWVHSTHAMATSSTSRVSEEGWVFGDISLNVSFTWSVLINGGEDSSRSLSWLVDLDECMRMILGLLASSTVIEVFGDAALVSWTNNRSHTTAIAFNIVMNGLFFRLWVDGSLSGGHGVDLLGLVCWFLLSNVLIWITVEHALEDLLALLVHLLLDHLLEGLLWNLVLLPLLLLLVFLPAFVTLLLLSLFWRSVFVRRGVIAHAIVFSVVIFASHDILNSLSDAGAVDLIHLNVFLLFNFLGWLWLDDFLLDWRWLDLLS